MRIDPVDPQEIKKTMKGEYKMKKYVNPNLTIISLAATDVLCTSVTFPTIDNEVPGQENDTPAVSMF